MNIVVANRQRAQRINPRLLKQIVTAFLPQLKIECAELGINLVAAPEMTLLNETFLRHKGPTDVITFDYAEKAKRASRLPTKPLKRKMDGHDACPALHGELFICVDEAILQSKRFKTSWQAEIVRYLIHGVLHLLGHGDRSPAARRKMKREENRWLREISRRFALSKL